MICFEYKLFYVLAIAVRQWWSEGDHACSVLFLSSRGRYVFGMMGCRLLCGFLCPRPGGGKKGDSTPASFSVCFSVM